jgi:hypothetical protein
LVVLPPYDTLMLPAQAEAAAARKQWVAAVKAVAAVHMLSAAAGLALRCAPALLGLLQQPTMMASWLVRPGDHAAELAVAAGLLLAVVVVSDGLASAASAAASTTAAEGITTSSGSGNAAELLRRVTAVEWSVAAAACAAAACLNWALSYVVCLLLVPLAIGCAPPSTSSSCRSAVGSQQGTGSVSKSHRGGAVKACVVLLCCSPLSVLLLLGALSSGGIAAAALPQWLADSMLSSSLGAYTAFWAVYMPGWCLTAWSVWVHLCC